MKNSLDLLKQRINELETLSEKQIAKCLLEIGDYKYAVLKDDSKFMNFLWGKLVRYSNNKPPLFHCVYWGNEKIYYAGNGKFIYEDSYGHYDHGNYVEYIVFNDKEEAILKFDKMVKGYINSLKYRHLFAPKYRHLFAPKYRHLFAPNMYIYNRGGCKTVDFDYTHFRENLKEVIDNTKLVSSELYLKLFDEKVEQLLKEHEEKLKAEEVDKKEKEAKKLEALSKLSDEDKLALGL